jgi:hypothetical protein
MSKGQTAGGECDAWCTKCKRDTLHNIVAMDSTGKTPAQVQCRSCQGTHKYRAPKETPVAKALAKGAPKTASAKKAAEKKTAEKKSAANSTASVYKRWEELLGRRGGNQAVPYKVTSAFGFDDVVEHKDFGVGFVIEEVAYNRIKVLFQDSERTLIARHGQKPPA